MRKFLVLDGEIEDCDGAIYKKNDLVSLKPGSKHFSVSHTGLHGRGLHSRRLPHARE